MDSEISLYFHIPFCTKKCSYCHFYVLPDKDPLKKQLMQGFKLEWERLLNTIKNQKIKTIYFGGGTPFLLGSDAIGEILNWIPGVENVAEITLEANPENISSQAMKEYADVGITRVSIGVQTLDNQLLKKIGRLHSSSRAIDAIYETYDSGIQNISIDLMYDLPGQTLSSWENTLRQAVNLPITHLSLYNLTIEPHTVFFKNRKTLEKTLPCEETSLQMYEMATLILSEKLKQYEISAFSKDNYQSKHNVGYWTARSFFGLGPSAFSYYENKRFRNIASLSKYHKMLISNESPVDFEEELEPVSRLRELLAINLRLIEGVDLRKFQNTHGVLDDETFYVLKKLQSDGFVARNSDRIMLTKRGILFYDTVASDLI